MYKIARTIIITVTLPIWFPILALIILNSSGGIYKQDYKV